VQRFNCVLLHDFFVDDNCPDKCHSLHFHILIIIIIIIIIIITMGMKESTVSHLLPANFICRGRVWDR